MFIYNLMHWDGWVYFMIKPVWLESKIWSLISVQSLRLTELWGAGRERERGGRGEETAVFIRLQSSQLSLPLVLPWKKVINLSLCWYFKLFIISFFISSFSKQVSCSKVLKSGKHAFPVKNNLFSHLECHQALSQYWRTFEFCPSYYWWVESPSSVSSSSR